MILTRNKLEIYHPNKRMVADRRKKSAWAVFSYIDKSSAEFVEYRRSFTAPAFTPEKEMWRFTPKTIKENN